MMRKRKSIVGLSLAFLVGGVVGLAIGGYGSFRLGRSGIIDECLYKDARAIQSHVVILKHLRTGKTGQGIELLEAQLDDGLILFDPWEPYPRLTDRTISEINKAIRESKEYRSANPRQSNRPFVDKMVTNVFSREPYK
ncbi:MAG: hypothetical protein A2Y65_05400 [Deltaproteobacteria bacterium RBG_13_52_11]|nr:MAG: hypothetical protein A2Y65_05400 [Deltaproteobacteria bacterium RBG_13_52_11]